MNVGAARLGGADRRLAPPRATGQAHVCTLLHTPVSLLRPRPSGERKLKQPRTAALHLLAHPPSLHTRQVAVRSTFSRLPSTKGPFAVDPLPVTQSCAARARVIEHPATLCSPADIRSEPCPVAIRRPPESCPGRRFFTLDLRRMIYTSVLAYRLGLWHSTQAASMHAIAARCSCMHACPPPHGLGRPSLCCRA